MLAERICSHYRREGAANSGRNQRYLQPHRAETTIGRPQGGPTLAKVGRTKPVLRRYFKRPARCAELFNPFVGQPLGVCSRRCVTRYAAEVGASCFQRPKFCLFRPHFHDDPCVPSPTSASPAGAGAGGCVGAANDWRRAPRADLDAKLAQRFRRRASGPEIGRDLQLDERACANPSIDAIPALKAGRNGGNFACRLWLGQQVCWFSRTVRRKAVPPCVIWLARRAGVWREITEDWLKKAGAAFCVGH